MFGGLLTAWCTENYAGFSYWKTYDFNTNRKGCFHWSPMLVLSVLNCYKYRFKSWVNIWQISNSVGLHRVFEVNIIHGVSGWRIWLGCSHFELTELTSQIFLKLVLCSFDHLPANGFPPTHLHFKVMLNSLIGLIALARFSNSTEASLHAENISTWSVALPLACKSLVK